MVLGVGVRLDATLAVGERLHVRLGVREELGETELVMEGLPETEPVVVGEAERLAETEALDGTERLGDVLAPKDWLVEAETEPVGELDGGWRHAVRTTDPAPPAPAEAPTYVTAPWETGTLRLTHEDPPPPPLG